MDLEHGKVGTYQKHRCRCAEYRAAATKAIRQWRAANPDKEKALRDRSRAKARRERLVLRRLADEYPARYVQLLDEQREIVACQTAIVGR